MQFFYVTTKNIDKRKENLNFNKKDTMWKEMNYFLYKRFYVFVAVFLLEIFKFVKHVHCYIVDEVVRLIIQRIISELLLHL